LHAAKPVAGILKACEVAARLAKGGPTDRPASAPARFKAGDRVRARNLHPVGHTRLPRYVRGHVGTVTHLHGVHVFPDVNATGQGEAPQWLYTVRFAGTELWGAAADPAVTVSVDAWESYLEPGQ
jgi:nitrile hydratase subunit beta